MQENSMVINFADEYEKRMPDVEFVDFSIFCDFEEEEEISNERD